MVDAQSAARNGAAGRVAHGVRRATRAALGTSQRQPCLFGVGRSHVTEFRGTRQLAAAVRIHGTAERLAQDEQSEFTRSAAESGLRCLQIVHREAGVDAQEFAAVRALQKAHRRNIFRGNNCRIGPFGEVDGADDIVVKPVRFGFDSGPAIVRHRVPEQEYELAAVQIAPAEIGAVELHRVGSRVVRMGFRTQTDERPENGGLTDCRGRCLWQACGRWLRF